MYTSDALWENLNIAAEGSNPYTIQLSLRVNTTVSNSYSANVGISAEGISAGIGQNVTESYQVQQIGTATVPYGHTVKIMAWAVMDRYTFDVWYNPILGGDYKAGSGEAFIYSGTIAFPSICLDC